MTRLMFGARAGRAARTAAALGVLALGLGSIAPGAGSAASPSPLAEPGAVVETDESTIEAWLDQPIPVDAPIGEAYAFGVTLWDTVRQRFPEFNEGFVRLHSATGSAKPTLGSASSDWPGHFAASVVVPRGGPGLLEVGVADQNQEFPFTVKGSGPPPEAPLAELVVATTARPPGPLVAGEPIDLTVTVNAQAAWNMDELGLPDELVAFVNRRGGPDLASTRLHDTGQRGGTLAVVYAGQITVPEPGEVNLQVAIPGNGTEDQVLRGATTRLRIGGAVAGPSSGPTTAPGAAAAVPAAGDLPWALVGIVAAVVLAGVVIGKVFADL